MARTSRPPTRRLPDGQTLLMLAARTGRVEAMKQLLRRGVNVNATEPRTGTSAVMWAAVADRGEAVRLLAEAGADLNARSTVTAYPHTPAAVVSDALEPGVSYVGQTVLPKGGWTPLMYAAREGAAGAIRALAEAGADLNAQDPDGTTALIFAIINGHADAAAALIEKGADPNVADKHRHDAALCRRGHAHAGVGLRPARSAADRWWPTR